MAFPDGSACAFKFLDDSTRVTLRNEARLY